MHACNVLSIVRRQFCHALEVEREGIVGGREVLLGDVDNLWKLVAFIIAVIAPRSGGGENTMFWYACMHMAPKHPCVSRGLPGFHRNTRHISDVTGKFTEISLKFH